MKFDLCSCARCLVSGGLFLINQTFLASETNFRLVPGKFTLGRSVACDLVVPDSSLSRRHCEITVAEAGGSIVVCDLKSKTGTYFAGAQVQSCTVHVGQRVQFGRVQFMLARYNSVPRQFDPEADTDDPRGDGTASNSQDLAAQSVARAIAKLLPAQGRVLHELIAGRSEKEAALNLHVSRHTVHSHVCEIYRAFNVHSRPELLALVLGASSIHPS